MRSRPSVGPSVGVGTNDDDDDGHNHRGEKEEEVTGQDDDRDDDGGLLARGGLAVKIEFQSGLMAEHFDDNNVGDENDDAGLQTE